MQYLFVGNRFFILETMFKLNLEIVNILTIKHSYLQKSLENKNISYESISSKPELIQKINNSNFDILISNGCPYILPVSDLKKQHQLFINIHPSHLPDLKGADPQPGSLLFGKDSGATCHIMDDGIDTGDIISQIKIPYSNDLDVALLYHLTFMAEKEVFIKAYEKKFYPTKKQENNSEYIYYTKKPQDLKIDFSKTAQEIYQQIKAFSNKSQGAYFIYDNEIYKVYDCEFVTNRYLLSKINSYKNNEVVFNYENKLLIRKNDVFLKLKCFSQDISKIITGQVLI